MGNKSILITFGCSWTFGIGAGYEDGMDPQHYEKNIRYDSELNWKYSWRKIVSEYFEVRNLNFSVGGSSNQRQFKEARNFFSSDNWSDKLKLYDNIIILWGITTTTRNYMYCKDIKSYRDLYLNLDALTDKNLFKQQFGFNQCEDKLAIAITKWSYNKQLEIENLEKDIIFFNKFISQFSNVKNFWFDTFNHHSYGEKIDNFIDYEKNNRDLLSYLVKRHIKENNISNSIKCDDKWDYAEKSNLLNPYSFHPKKESYKQIAEYFIQKLKPHFQSN